MSTPEAARGARVVHVTTVHARDDVRIFHKQCRALAAAGYDVVQVVGDGRGDAQVHGVRIVDLGARPAGRLARMREQPGKALAAVLRLQPALVHFHDPELLRLGRSLARRGVPTIYDAHEDVPRQILTKQWIPAPLRRWVSRGFEHYENRMVRSLAAVVTATPHIEARFAPLARSVTVANYPRPDELPPPAAMAKRERAMCYVGSITRTRGALQMVRAAARLPDVDLHLAGLLEDDPLLLQLKAEPGWARAHYHGQLDRAGVAALLGRCSVGLVTLQPMPSYLDALPIKLFEYMAAELPVVASDFPLWRHIVLRHQCGRCVDPLSPEAIADAVKAILADPTAAAAMGAAGRAAVLAEYQWASQEATLLALYRQLLAGDSQAALHPREAS